MLKNTFVFILKILAQATLWRYQPKIVGVTGNVGKTSAKEAIFAVLEKKFNARRNYKNYNNEIGVPLTILGLETGGHSLRHWFKIFFFAVAGIFYTKNYPEILVLEMGADKIGDIAYLTSFVKCDVAVITAIGDIPVHVEFFQSVSHVAQEKANLIKGLTADGWAVLNFDDKRVKAMISETKGQIFSFGFGEGVNLRASNLEEHLEEIDKARLSFKVEYQGSNVPIKLDSVLGAHQAYPALAAIAVGLILKMNLVEISQALSGYRSPAGRLRLLKGIKNSWILDDTYNAAPSSTLAALDVLSRMKGRKIAALGDMLELGAFCEEAHRQAGAKAATFVDWLLVVGERAIFIADQAKKDGLAEDKITHFVNSEEAGYRLRDLIREGDIILVKGSQAIRMEKIVKEIMAEPEKAGEFLVRQEEEWLRK